MCNPKNILRLLINRRYVLNIRVLILLCSLVSPQLFSQQQSDKPHDSDISNFKEETFVRTDREIYISGEQVWLKVYTLNGLTGAPCNISKIVYLELLDKNNFPLRQLKVKIESSSGSSGFLLPDNISSGNYIIRAYTNWMKNFSTDQFCYKTISVINPFESIDHLRLPGGTTSSDSVIAISSDQSRLMINDIVVNPEVRKSPTGGSRNHINYSITLDKPQYLSREKVKMEISANDKDGNPVETDLSVSVARSV